MTRRVLLTVILTVSLASANCASDCDVHVENGDWSYTRSRTWTRRGRVCVSELRYRDEHVLAGKLLITPLGTFRVRISEHGYEDHGWVKVADTTPGDVPIGTAPISPASLAAGFYESGLDLKLEGTPPDWVYIGEVTHPGWASPAKLRDLAFVREHPPVF